jgi:hypothetical protein
MPSLFDDVSFDTFEQPRLKNWARYFAEILGAYVNPQRGPLDSVLENANTPKGQGANEVATALNIAACQVLAGPYKRLSVRIAHFGPQIGTLPASPSNNPLDSMNQCMRACNEYASAP